MSTIRQVKALNMRGIEPAVITSEKPLFEWVNPGSLYVEETYQRGIAENSLTMIRKIVGRWNWAHIKPPVCVRDAKGRLVVLDGQHTAISAVSHGGIPKIPVMIVEANSLQARATAFISQNRDRIALTPSHIHFAAVAAGDELAVAVDDACKKSGACIVRHPRGSKGVYKIGETFGIGVITRIVKIRGVFQTARVLKVLIDAKRAPLPAHEIAAVSMLLFEPEYKGKVDPFDLVTVIRSKTVQEWQAAAAKVMATGTSRRTAIAVVWKRAVDRG
ncbi:DUF6551 family protein [Tardiphaga sp.]|uniref:DUF6551 family protein n=1 Tax=Tardiphaga sp. TaxID=1926292 RepID=UPI002639F8B7|nr:DUF6551 family protein [Tardiphaga sp.]MDB5620540.1 hypothetical protein [Tardiphaga sp.]